MTSMTSMTSELFVCNYAFKQTVFVQKDSDFSDLKAKSDG